MIAYDFKLEPEAKNTGSRIIFEEDYEMMKTFSSFGLCLLFVAGGLFATGGVESSAAVEEKVTLTAMYGSPDWPDLNDELLAQFMVANPNVEVEYTPIGVGDFDAFIQARIAANELPDVVTINPGAFGVQLADEGWLADLSDTKTAQNEIDAVKGAFTTSDGTLFGVPFGFATLFFFYNESLFAEAGVTDSDIPRDWDSFLALNRKLQSAGIVPMIHAPGMASLTFFSFPFAQNVVPSDPNWRQKMVNGTFDFEIPEVIDVFAKWAQLRDFFQEGEISADYNTMNQLFVQGHGAMIFMGSWGATSLSDSEANGFETGSFMPTFNNAGESPAVAVAPETGLAANARGSNLAMAKTFIDWILYDKYSEIQEARGSIPHLQKLEDAVLPQTVLNVLPQMQASAIGGELYFTYMPATLGPDAIGAIWQEIMLDTKTPDQAAAAMQDLYEQAF